MKNILNSLLNLLYKISRLRAKFKTMVLRPFLAECGKSVYLEKGTKIARPKSTFLGSNVYINHQTLIGASNKAPIKIGNFVSIGPYCYIISSKYDYKDWQKPVSFDTKMIDQEVVIEDDVVIGVGVTVLPGVTLGRGCLVGAGAVVTNDVEPYSIVAGIPAKHIKYRFDAKTREKASQVDLNKFIEG